MTEVERKLEAVRAAMARETLSLVRLRGIDWYAWATCGGSSAVLLAAETGVAEVLITPQDAIILTDEIEAERLDAEENPARLPVRAVPWNQPAARETIAQEFAGSGQVASDRPGPRELPLPEAILVARWQLQPEELDRYRALGRDAAEAMTDVLLRAEPTWTGWQLAGAGAEALWSRGIHPNLTLVGNERRLPIYRHATAVNEPLGERAMLVYCGRRHGLYANLTRFVYFRPPQVDEQRLIRDVAVVEARALDASRPGATLGSVYDVIVKAYADLGFPGAERKHHQGGSCGYGSRDALGLPGNPVRLTACNAIAWNPSLPGAKIEDTFVTTPAGVENLTLDPRWPTETVEGRARPAVLVR
ncbi:MAG TPA: M24 family metallopeptidase [Deinococcales bacterium]|nr:M24 family metallopeptidase [Deinococcales bacterium]